MTAAEALEAAALVISLPDWWTQGTLATDEHGRPTDYADARACKFCASGALKAACKGDAFLYFDALANISDIVWINDRAKTSGPVVAEMFRAAEKLRKAR